jgi:glutamyl-tRNA synthetase
VRTPLRARFAPSPTGDLHLGGALTAVAAWCLARSTGGATILRVEDLDQPRVVPGSEARQHEDLAWLGLDWDEGPDEGGGLGPYRQTERTGLYEAALDDLTAQGRTYPCDCSRAEIARVASAPHDGEELVYPGLCRDRTPGRPMRRPPAIRLRLEPNDAVPWDDGLRGAIDGSLVQAGGDFVLRRGDGVFAYQLAVAVDDLAMQVEAVVRGDDLVTSTPRQLLLMELWETRGRLAWARGARPRYWHLPLVRAADGSRLAKRAHGVTLRDVRASGVEPATVVGALGQALGLLPPREAVTATALAELVAQAGTSPAFSREPWRVPAGW